MSVMSDEPLVEGGRKGYYYQTLEESLVVCLDRSMEDEIVDRRMEQNNINNINNLLFARNIATSDKSQPKSNNYWAKDNNVSGTGIVPEVGSSYQTLEQEQEGCQDSGMEDMIVTRGMVLSEMASAGGDAGDIAYVDGQPGGGLPQDVEDVQNDEQQHKEDQVAMHSWWMG